MTKEELLSQLKSIHLPQTYQPWWELAIGWYILLTLILMMTLVASYFLFKKHKQNKAYKSLLYKANSIYENNQNNCHQYASEMSVFLKQVVMKYDNKTAFHTRILYGNNWVEFLNNYLPFSEISTLVQGAYNPEIKFNVDDMQEKISLLLKKIYKTKK